ncbi:PfkB family carbohydrate kinase [Candidatus Magnetomonas plexicatena]|uniref:PfkB family carbohydrate kinase n=1 Tax=Candidatus Magnetomonas plexicatena TaxID=2552947 RepID=UPI001C750C9D|nr:adenylyltransferase/cytidyltransferase family protein [Nitrospirales bacterium LBB_01]
MFDLIHPGTIRHLKDAKNMGDILIVTVIQDSDVRKGPGRPIFHDTQRAENVASLSMVDYVSIVDDTVPFQCIKRLKPDIFAKGRQHKENDNQIRDKIYAEEKDLYFGLSKIMETSGFSITSSKIINNFLDIYPEHIKTYLREFSKVYPFDYIKDKLDCLKGYKVLIIGDGIVDEYCYCETMGKSPKADVIVNRFLSVDVFAGGAFAIANHVSGLCNHVHLVSVLGLEDTREDFVKSSLRPNIKATFFYRDDAPTIIKKRYINTHNTKVFEVNYINDTSINEPLENQMIDFLNKIIKDYDLVLVSDFGHGLITKRLIGFIEAQANMVAVNTQTNGANAGLNLITKYGRTDFICLDGYEARLATQMKYEDFEDVAVELMAMVNTERLIITAGSAGSLCISRGGSINRTPAFATKVIDVIGAGDAFFSYAAPCMALGMPVELVSFISNAVGALAVAIIGNKRPVEKYEVLEFIQNVLQ